MREREETFDYPPRLRIECVHIDSSKPLYSSFKVSKKHNNIMIGEFSLVKQVTGMYVTKWYKMSEFILPLTCCLPPYPHVHENTHTHTHRFYNF